jgi:hypothetical protein
MKGRETGPSALETSCEWKGPVAFQVENENVDATVFDYGSFPVCTQAQTGLTVFALVESIRRV